MRKFINFALDAFDSWILVRLILLALAIIAGLLCAGISIYVGDVAMTRMGGSFSLGSFYAAGATVRVSFYVFAAIVGFCGYQILFFPENVDVRYWAAVIAGMATKPLISRSFGMSDAGAPMAAMWGCCLLLLVMIGAGLWTIRSWRMSQWAAELHELQVENEARRAERDLENSVEPAISWEPEPEASAPRFEPPLPPPKERH